MMRYSKGNGPRVLLVEPNGHGGESLATLLEGAGYRVMRYLGPRTTNASARADSPDLILLGALALTPTEHRLLGTLISRPNEFVSREELARSVWGYADPGIRDAINVHMHRLRSKLARLALTEVAPPEIRSIRGRGYAFWRPRPDLSMTA